jgi:hypothetical protein
VFRGRVERLPQSALPKLEPGADRSGAGRLLRCQRRRPPPRGDALGLIPYWAKDIKIGFSTINARAEEVDTKPAFPFRVATGRPDIVWHHVPMIFLNKEGQGATAIGPRAAGNDTFQEGEWDLPGRQGVHFGTAQFDRLAVGGTWPSRLLSL